MNHLTSSLTSGRARRHSLTRQADPCWGSWPEAILTQEGCLLGTISQASKDFELYATGPGMREPCQWISFVSDSNPVKRENFKSSRRKPYKGTPIRLIFQQKLCRSVGVPWYTSSAKKKKKKKTYNQEFPVWQGYHWELKERQNFPHKQKLRVITTKPASQEMLKGLL